MLTIWKNLLFLQRNYKLIYNETFIENCDTIRQNHPPDG